MLATRQPFVQRRADA